MRNTPYTSTIRSDFDEFSQHSEESSEVQDATSDSQNYPSLNMPMVELDSRLFVLELKSRRMERDLHNIQFKRDITRNNSFTPSEIVRLESLIDANKRDIMKLNEKVTTEGNDREADDLAARDLVDDTIEMQALFAENKFDERILDIPKTRLVIKFMLKFMDLSKINDKEISLLRKISNSSKNAARALISDVFTHLVNIFDQLKSEFDEILESESRSDSDDEIADADEDFKESEKSDEDSDQESEEDSAENSVKDSDQESEEDSAENGDIDSDQESEEDLAFENNSKSSFLFFRLFYYFFVINFTRVLK